MPISIRGQSIDAAVRNPEDMRRLLVGVAHKLALYDGRLNAREALALIRKARIANGE